LNSGNSGKYNVKGADITVKSGNGNANSGGWGGDIKLLAGSGSTGEQGESTSYDFSTISV
jgi:hypothetical protein